MKEASFLADYESSASAQTVRHCPIIDAEINERSKFSVIGMFISDVNLELQINRG